jgi:hypothetical protein
MFYIYFMIFKDFGFSEPINNYDSEFKEWYFKSFELRKKYVDYDDIKFKLSNYFLTNRQSAKKIFLKRNKESTDDIVNKSVYGSDLIANQGINYTQWITDNDEKDDIVRKSENISDDLDAPYQPINTESEIYEYIDYLKRKLEFDFFSIECLLIEINKQKERIYDILEKISDYGSSDDMKTVQISIFILTINSLFEIALSICDDMIFKIQKTEDNFIHFKYIEFVVSPIYIEEVMVYFTKLTNNIISEKNNLLIIKRFIIGCKKLIIDGIEDIKPLDRSLETANTILKNAQKIAPAAGPAGFTALATATNVYELTKEEINNNRIKIIRNLVSVTNKLPQLNLITIPEVPKIKN